MKIKWTKCESISKDTGLCTELVWHGTIGDLPICLLMEKGLTEVTLPRVLFPLTRYIIKVGYGDSKRKPTKAISKALLDALIPELIKESDYRLAGIYELSDKLKTETENMKEINILINAITEGGS